MPKSRCIVFTTAYFPLIGGAEVAIEEVIRRLHERFDFYVITHRARRDLPKEEVRDGARIFRLGFGTKIDRLFLFPFLAFWKGFWLSLEVPKSMLWGVMVTYASIGAFFVKIMRPKVPFILTLQEGDSEAHLTFAKFGQTGLWWWAMLKFADEITAISTYLEHYARRRGFGGHSEIIPNGVDIAKFQDQKRVREGNLGPENSRVIITTSRLVKKNGIDILIRAVAEVKNKFPEVRCYIVGDGEEGRALEILREKLNLQKEVIFYGNVPHEKVPELLREAHLFVRPSRSEGMGNSFVEALSVGIPIIGTSVGGITDIIEDRKTGVFANPDDPHDLAQKIILLFRDKELAERIAAEGGKMVRERFSWDGITEKYGAVFQRVLGQRKIHILLATPLYPPQLGGPALYAKHLKEELENLGVHISLSAFTSYLRFPPILRHIFYFIGLLYKGFKSDIIFALDQTSVGLPSAAVSFLLRKPLVLRVEGDFLWEHFVERTHREISLPAFFFGKEELSLKERIWKILFRWVLVRGRLLVFSSEWRKDMIVRSFGIFPEQTCIIRNAWPAAGTTENLPRQNVVLWAGRMLYLKNLFCLIRAFSRVNDGLWELHLVGDGPLRKDLQAFVSLQKISGIRFFDPLPRVLLLRQYGSSAFFALPSFSEVGPNVIADAIATKTPFFMTKESGYYEYVKDLGLFVDPLSEKDIEEKIKMLMNVERRREYTAKIESFLGTRSWGEVAKDWYHLFERISLSQ